MPRDWDLFSFAGVPLAIACYYAVLDERFRLRAATSLATLAVALGLVALLPRAVIQATPDLSIALYDDIRNLDPLRSSGGEFWLHRYLTDHGREREAVRRQQLNVERAQHEILDRQGQALMRRREYVQAIEKFKLAVEKAPIYSNAWTNMGLCYLQLGQTDSALQALKIADAMNPYNFNNLNGLARTYFTREEYAAAETYWLKATDLAPYELGPYDFLLIVYDLRESGPDRDRLLARLIQSANEPQAPLAFVVGATQTLLRRNRVEYARPLYEKALGLGLDSSLARDLQARYPALGP